MKNMIQNYINGNLMEARKQARKFSLSAIAAELRETCGYSATKATLTADYLKTGRGWQAACDAA